jgi:hypothetical protein
VSDERQNMEYGETPVVFLAMFWGGGGPYTIPQIIHVYDWINRAVPTRGEMESAINTLLAMGLIEQRGNTFRVSESHGRAFDAYRKKKRKRKFVAVRMFFQGLPSVATVPRVIRLTEAQYKKHIETYRKAFNDASG